MDGVLVEGFDRRDEIGPVDAGGIGEVEFHGE
jgi:hypothetical protein